MRDSNSCSTAAMISSRLFRRSHRSCLTSKANSVVCLIREAFREGFQRLRSQVDMYPVPGRHASLVFESAAQTVRALAAGCLPLGIAVAMHLYPLCVLQCMPLPLLSFARFQRTMLLRTIRHRSLILANAGGERTRGADPSLVAHPDADGIRIDAITFVKPL